MAGTHVVKVVFERQNNSIVSIGIPGDSRRSRYTEGEAESSAVCLALETVVRRIARWQMTAGDGFTVRVEFVNEAGEPLAPPATDLRPASGRGDFHANMEWIEKNRREYGGRWVALQDGQLVVVSDSERLLRAHLATRDDARELLVAYVEPEAAPGDAAFAEMEAVADADDG